MRKPRNPQWGYSGGRTVTAGPPIINHLITDHGLPPDHDPIGGILLEVQKICPPANSVFTPEELEERIARMAAKVEADLAAEKKATAGVKFSRAAANRCRRELRELAAVKVLSCAGCRCDLLAPSEEGRRKQQRDRLVLPPPVAVFAGRQAAAPEGRPYCAACLDTPVKPVVLLKGA